ncbi:MAG: hypothetical protein PHC50_09745 [Candidatus Cloacimonetes bacterium]|nr:hypothetical protein [Candidatus Cloacimonadota bacterium]
MRKKACFNLLVFAMFALLILFGTSCSKDKEDKIDYYSEIGQDFVGFLRSHAWHISVYATEDEEDSSRLNLEVYAANYAEHVPYTDDFYMSVNGNEIAGLGWWDESFQELSFQNISIVKGEKVKVVFKHNDEIIIDKTVKVPAIPAFTEVPDNPDFDQDLSFNWELSKNSDLQSIMIWASAYNVHTRTYVLAPETCSFTLPADTIVPQHGSSVKNWGMQNSQYNIVESGNCVLFACTRIIDNR